MGKTNKGRLKRKNAVELKYTFVVNIVPTSELTNQWYFDVALPYQWPEGKRLETKNHD
jgi:hypothetical protein